MSSVVIGKPSVAEEGMQEIAVIHDVNWAGSNWTRETRFSSYEPHGMVLVDSPFGKFLYGNNKRDADAIANELVKLAGEIRKRSR